MLSTIAFLQTMKIYLIFVCFFVNFYHSLNRENYSKPKKGLIIKFKEDSYNESIKLLVEIGYGSYGEVWLGIEKVSGTKVAVKFEAEDGQVC